MINDFLEIPKIMPPIAQIPSGYLKKLRRAYSDGRYEYGLELAITLMELYTFGHYSTENENIRELIELEEDGAKSKVSNYVDKVKETEELIIFNQNLDVIADMEKKKKT